jgi:DNA modification methylase
MKMRTRTSHEPRANGGAGVSAAVLGPYDLDAIHTGDCRELAQAIPDGAAMLAFADPPYWVGFKYNGKTDAEMDYIEPAWLAAELQRIGKVAMITPSIGHMYKYPEPRWVVAWHKPAAMGRNVAGGVNAWEPILVYGKGRIDIDVLTAQVGGQSDAKFHACPKPIKLMEQIINYFTKPGDIVVDLMCGSATTLVAAKKLGRHYLGFELDSEMAEHSRRRLVNTQTPLLCIEDAAAQPTLFDVTA